MNDRHPAVFGHHRRKRRAVDVVNLARRQRLAWGHDLVARREDGHARRRVDQHLGVAERGYRTHAAGREHRARRQYQLARADVLPLPADVLAGRGRREQLDIVAGGRRFLHHHHRIGAVGHGCARGHFAAEPGGHRLHGHLAGVDRFDAPQEHRSVAGGARRVGGAHGVAVHGGACEWRHVGRRQHVAREHAAADLAERHRLGAIERPDGRRDDVLRLGERNRGLERPHLHHYISDFWSCCATWPSSGMMSRDIASRTACSDPGSTKIALAPTVPAVARLIIAAEPISSKLSMRNSSPKPSSRFSKSASIASNVPSRALTPVPPVVMMTRVSASVSHCFTDAVTSAGSSRTIANPVAWWPARSRNSRMARPLESVSLVRVSLTVSTKQPTETGPLALCSWWLTVLVLRL